MQCPACDASVDSTPFPIPDREYGILWVASYAACNECGSYFQVPMPEPARLADFYPASYHSFAGRGILTRIRFDMRIRRLRALAMSKGLVLDHGCGDGSFLLRAAEQMPEHSFFGYEISDHREVIELCRGRVTLVRGAESDLFRLLPSCGLITMNHVIEHLPNPLFTLSQLREHLMPGGIIEGQTPAAKSLEHRLFGKRWSGYHAPRHTVVFSPKGLNRALARAGFEVLGIRGAFNPASIAVSLSSLAAPAELPSRIERKGLKWLCSLALATPLSAADFFSGAPGIVNFSARRPIR
jgi:SAM-dependent methyltransferase